MGIVVCLVMLLGLLQLELKHDSLKRWALVVACLLLVAGMWNAMWYGLQHLGEFWGHAALISGLAMLLSAVIIAGESDSERCSGRAYTVVNPFRLPIVIALAASFLLYSITLVRLNVGLPIIN